MQDMVKQVEGAFTNLSQNAESVTNYIETDIKAIYEYFETVGEKYITDRMNDSSDEIQEIAQKAQLQFEVAENIESKVSSIKM